MHCASLHNQKKDNNKFKNKTTRTDGKSNYIRLGSPTANELKKKHSSRPVGGAEASSKGGEASRQGGSWRTRMGGGWQSRWSHICMWINQKEQLGSKTDHTTQGSSVGK